MIYMWTYLTIYDIFITSCENKDCRNSTCYNYSPIHLLWVIDYGKTTIKTFLKVLKLKNFIRDYQLPQVDKLKTFLLVNILTTQNEVEKLKTLLVRLLTSYLKLTKTKTLFKSKWLLTSQDIKREVNAVN